jgi:hypothetical protein
LHARIVPRATAVLLLPLHDREGATATVQGNLKAIHQSPGGEQKRTCNTAGKTGQAWLSRG